MTDEKWQEIVGLVKDKFEIEKHETLPLENIPDGTVETIIFAGPLGRMKLEFTGKPLVLGTKAVGARRIGSQKTIEYLTSDTEKTFTFKAYRDEGGDNWVEMEAGATFLSE
ncbi:hypothetical protein ACFL04_01715 [Patescibacteria group bacterium]